MAGIPAVNRKAGNLGSVGGFVTAKTTNAGAGPHLDVLTILSFALNRYASIIEFSNMLIDVSYAEEKPGFLVNYYSRKSALRWPRGRLEALNIV
ncbi:hypothetical protein [Thiolapillus sp.]